MFTGFSILHIKPLMIFDLHQCHIVISVRSFTVILLDITGSQGLHNKANDDSDILTLPKTIHLFLDSMRVTRIPFLRSHSYKV